MGINQTIDITTEEREVVLGLLQRHLPGVAVWVYGSRAKWTSRPESDLDLVVFATPEQSRKIGDLREAFEESNLPFRVDLFVWSEVPKQFHREIERDHVVLMGEGECNHSKLKWPVSTIEEVSEKVAMGPFGSAIKVETFVPDGVPIISGKHLHGAKVDDTSGFNFITEEHAQKLANANVQRGDVVFTHAGNIGQVAYIPEHSEFSRYIISQRQFYMRCNRSKVIPEFLTAYFRSHEGKHKLLANTSQVGVPSIAQPVTYLRTIEIPVPPLPEQRAIAHILGTLDDKIELNRRMNETIETMAQTLFKSWFVDFDPVRAKMTLKQHHSPPQHHSPLEGESQSAIADVVGGNHSPLEGESQSAIADVVGGNHSPLEGESNPQNGFGGGNNDQATDPDLPPPHQSSPDGSPSATPPQGGSDWTVKRLYPEKTLNRAKSMRYNQTDAEGLLWHYLRNKQLDGYKFRRQQPVGPYIVDFACLPEKLLIELDGGQHAEQETYDEQRDQFLQSQGYRVLRFWNNEVFDNCFAVLEQIYQTLNHSPPQHHSPLEGESQSAIADVVGGNHSPLEGESQSAIADVVGGNHSPLEGESNPQSGFGGGNNDHASNPDLPPPHQSSPDGSPSATPPQRGSDWTVERARAYLDRMDPEIAALFPDNLVDSELGEIPEGWTTILIKQLGRVVTGKTPSTKKPEFFGTEVPFLKIPDMHGRIYVIRTLISLSKEGAMSQAHKTVPAGSVSVSCIATPGLVVLNHRDTQTNQQINSIIPTDHMQSHFIFWSCRRLAAEVMLGGSGGSVFHNMNKTSFENLRLIYPGKEIARTYSKTVIQIHNRELSNEYETDTLAQIRDMLLPKLISGEIRLRENGETVEAAI